MTLTFWGKRTAQGSVHKRVTLTQHVPIDRGVDGHVDEILEGSFCIVTELRDGCVVGVLVVVSHTYRQSGSPSVKV